MTAEPDMLVLARESRGWTQVDVAEAMSRVDIDARISQGYVSRAEAGRLAVTGERLLLFAAALRYTPELLCSTAEVHGVGIGLVHHRKRASMGTTGLRRIHAILALSRMQTKALTRAADLPGDHRFHHIPINELDTPPDAADQLREDWRMPPGPVPDLVALVEHAGALVLARDLGTGELDAVSQWSAGEPPLFLLNSTAPPDRFRFSLAHELGHVVMHTEPGSGREQEDQADRFAAEFLMPYEDITADLKKGVDLARLLELKGRWGVSMAALVRRALTLSVISDWQYRNIMVEMSALGYRTTEPGMVPRETPQGMARVVTRLQQHYGLSPARAAHVAGLTPDEFDEIYRCASSLPESSPLSACL
ncbi:Zn-dependent peptidase ImmA, M78 family [Streptosporangium subroseum]|uniref:Zn-dependent peptidase ImmA, M78 family n=2 Tax=Streptosporangium subroseum TaxID=106412 RepID=A0A239PAR5_9ACTN|nr:Zn-dependent peptidase ImmA, M78 family [Streptosporangium subroseum]